MSNRIDDRLANVKAELSEALDAWMKQQGDAGMEAELKVPLMSPLK